MSAEAVAAAILRGIARDRFVIAPGASMAALARLHSVAAPILHRFWFDPLIARLHRRAARDAHAKAGR
jgi:3-dehydrosphinganine reductase